MKQITKSLILLTLFTFLSSCNKNSVEPEPNYEPGRRDYVWTMDTIKAYYIYFNSIWGKNANDVWAVSSVGSVFENIYRYDGTKWYRETRTPIGNTVSLSGTENNLWICCKDGRIWNYKNDAFTSSPQFKYENEEILFFSMAGKNDNEIYAGGGKRISYNKDALLYKCTDNNWQQNNVLKNYGNVYWLKYSSRNNKYYFLTYLDNETLMDTVKLFEYDGKEPKMLFENSTIEDFRCSINDVDGYIYVLIGNKILRYTNREYQPYLEINLPNFGGQFWGRNKNDFFIRMQDGLLHYNGTDLEYILKFPVNITFGSCALVLEKDIFLHAHDDKTGYNIIYHGTLKEN
jgi:hypothetical protein